MSAFDGRHVLITGAASGIGRQLARDLHRLGGCHLSLVDIDATGLHSLADELTNATAYPTDISSAQAVEALAAHLDGSPPDILINVAGVLGIGPFERTRIEDFERVIDVNLLGTVRMTKALLPLLRRSDRAFIVTLASAAGLVGAPGMAAYSASKFALVGFSQALRMELRGRVGVCVVCPTLFRTSIVRNAALSNPSDDRSSMENILFRFGSTPERVSRAIIQSIRRRGTFVLVTPDAYLLYLLHRFSPKLVEFLVHRIYRRLIRKGVLRE